MKRKSRKGTFLRVLRGDSIAAGVGVVGLSLVVGFISLPILILLLWTVSENSWQAMATPVAREALFSASRRPLPRCSSSSW